MTNATNVIDERTNRTNVTVISNRVIACRKSSPAAQCKLMSKRAVLPSTISALTLAVEYMQ